MGNMSYCRFENTYRDLADCFKALLTEGGVKGIEQDANKYEKPYIKMLIQLCMHISEEFQDEL